ncbi:hypothetical protein ACHAPU_002845 [Fusarium lateritium]
MGQPYMRLPEGGDDRNASASRLSAPRNAHLATTTLQVGGMTCGACTSAVESGFKGVDGVGTLSVSLVMERAVVMHDPQIISAEKIQEIIEDRGFDAEVFSTDLPSPVTTRFSNHLSDESSEIESEAESATTTFAIEGMTCGACTSAVEAGFNNVDGLLKFNISLLAERAVITYDESKLSPEKIAEIIEDRGFDVTVLSTQRSSNHQRGDNAMAQFKVFGCKDATTTQNLEEGLIEVQGIKSASLSLSTDRLTVVYQQRTIGLRGIVEAVEAHGLNALVASGEDNNAQLESLAKTREITEWRTAFKTSLAFAIPVLLIGMIIPMCLPVIDIGSLELIPGLFLGDIVCFVLTLPVQFGIGKRFYISAYKSLKHKSPTMDVLVILGTSCAFFFSVLSMLISVVFAPHSKPSTIFDTSTMLITFITLARWLENRAKGQTSRALSRLMSLAPSTATIYADPIAVEKAAENWAKSSDLPPTPKTPRTHGPSGSAWEEKVVPTELLQVDDIVVIRPGDKIPADGILVRGATFVDESMVTGEAMPVQKYIGDNMIGGTINGDGRVDLRITRAGHDTQLSQIVKLVQDAQTARAPIQQLADTLAGYFVPMILILGLGTFLVWMVLCHVLSNPPKIFLDDNSGGKVMVCVKLCISVIVFACPCALGLATPTAVMVGTGVGAENGILIKGGAALERITKVTQIVLDKTGTITYGKMSVASIGLVSRWAGSDSKRLWWSIVGLAEMGSEHPVGKAILGAAKEALDLGLEGTIDGSVGDFKAVVGKGVSVTVEPAAATRSRYEVQVGNLVFLQDNGIDVPEDAVEAAEKLNLSTGAGSSRAKSTIRSAGTTNIFVAIDGLYTGHLCLSDIIKEDAAAAILVLHRMGIKTAIVTGDQRSTALAVASAVGIDANNVYAGVSPDQKQAIVQEIQDRGEVVGMVGDGINDSPALATADVGIAMASGTDVAMEAADVVLMRPTELMNIPAALALTHTIFFRIKLNLGWACMYNAIGLPIAMGFFLPLGLSVHPIMAGLAMAFSSVTVVVSSLMLKSWTRPGWMDEVTKNGGKIAKGERWISGRAIVDWVKSVVGRRDKVEEGGYVPLQNMEG